MGGPSSSLTGAQKRPVSIVTQTPENLLENSPISLHIAGR